MIIRDYRLQADWLAKGKYPVGVGTGTVVEEYMEVGAPIKHYLLKEGSYISSGAVNLAMINRAPHPYASKFFVNWLLSKEGQTVYSTAASVTPIRSDVPDSAPEAARFGCAPFDFAQALQPKQRKSGIKMPHSKPILLDLAALCC